MENQELITVEQFHLYMHSYHQQDFLFVGHTHPSWEINILLNGELEVTYEEHIITMRKNSILLFEPGAFHRNHAISKNGTEHLVFQFHTDSISIIGKPRLYIADDCIQNIISLITAECENNKYYNGYYNRKLNSISRILLELFLTKLHDAKSGNFANKNNNAIIFETAVKYMKDNVDKNLTVEEIANISCVSVAKLKRLFAEYTQSGIIKIFNDFKLKKALQYLREGKSVIDTANLLSFSSQSYFSSWFKRLTGTTPIKYKHQPDKYSAYNQSLIDI